MPDIFDEVAEDLRKDRYERLWKRYGWVLMAAVLAILAATAGWQTWQWRQREAAQQATQGLLAAMRAPDAASGRAALEPVARESGPGPRTLARLLDAARRATDGNLAEAVPIWDSIAADREVEPLYRDLATLLWAMHTLDAGDPAQLAARLGALAQADNPWRHLAAEQQALLAERQGNRDAAVAAFRSLAADATAPAGVRERAQQMLVVLGAAPGAAG